MARISQETISRLCMLSCERVAEQFDIEVRKHKALCFMHEDHHPSLSFFGKNREKWYCFVYNKGGSAIDFVTEYTALNFVEACQWLCQTFGIPIENYFSTKNNLKKVRIKKRLSLEEAEKPFSEDVAQWILDNNSLTKKGKEFLFGKRFLNTEVIKRLNVVGNSIESDPLRPIQSDPLKSPFKPRSFL